MAISTLVQVMPSKKPKFLVIISPELKRDFERLCHIENRSMSNMAVTLIQKAVDEARARGLLDDQRKN